MLALLFLSTGLVFLVHLCARVSVPIHVQVMQTLYQGTQPLTTQEDHSPGRRVEGAISTLLPQLLIYWKGMRKATAHNPRSRKCAAPHTALG